MCACTRCPVPLPLILVSNMLRIVFLLFIKRSVINCVYALVIDRYADAVILNLEETHGESNIRVPMVCLLSQGSDPTDQIATLAKKKGLDCRAISMGQGEINKCLP